MVNLNAASFSADDLPVVGAAAPENLSREDYNRMIGHLNYALMVFGQANKILCAAEIRTKSLINSVKTELERRQKELPAPSITEAFRA
ncbi:MAG TPA: hypothetical protein VEB66_01385 [Opitutaceae bacterium]|nr:hypothetical protein [Opitutaceae bacterium]